MNPKKIVNLNVIALLSTIVLFGTHLSFAQGNKTSVHIRNGKTIIPSRDVGLDQKLNGQVPLDIPFKDEAGKSIHLSDYFGKKPVILNLIFYRCPGVCTMELDGMVKAFNKLHFNVGEEFDAITVSINPKESPSLAADKKDTYLQIYKRPTAVQGWHFLTGDQESIQRLASAIGYRYAYDLDKEQFAHPAGILILTPKGKISKYFYGSDYSPRDLGLGLIEASENRIGSPVEQILLFCLHYDAATGKYSFVVVRLLQIASFLTIVSLGSFILIMIRWEKNRYKNIPIAPRDKDALHNV